MEPLGMDLMGLGLGFRAITLGALEGHTATLMEPVGMHPVGRNQGSLGFRDCQAAEVFVGTTSAKRWRRLRSGVGGTL